MWIIYSTQTFIDYFEDNGLVQTGCSTLSADFSADATDICEMDMVTFSDLSFGEINSWNWTFEGGDPAISTEPNPVVTYNEEGMYDVELTVSDGTSANTMSMEEYITVLMTPEVELLPFDDVCVGWPAFELSDGSPEGGEYSGPGVEEGWFDPAVAGLGTHTIMYSYTSDDGCENYNEQTILVDPCTGIDEIESGQISIYPNPSNGTFDLKLNYQGSISIQVVNIIGVTVYNEQVFVSGKLIKSIDLKGFEAGIYFVSIQTEEKAYVKKLKLID